jgi:hypothetical protein
MVERFHATPVQPAVPNEECVRASDYDAIAAELAEAETRERHARELCWLLVQAAGGEIRIPDDLIIRMPRDAALETFNTFEFRGQVYRATRLTDSAAAVPTCPRCGSTVATLVQKDYYECGSCADDYSWRAASTVSGSQT